MGWLLLHSSFVSERVEVRSLVRAFSSSVCVCVCLDRREEEWRIFFLCCEMFFFFFFFQEQVKLSQGDKNKWDKLVAHFWKPCFFITARYLYVCRHAECVLVKENASVWVCVCMRWCVLFWSCVFLYFLKLYIPFWLSSHLGDTLRRIAVRVWEQILFDCTSVQYSKYKYDWRLSVGAKQSLRILFDVVLSVISFDKHDSFWIAEMSLSH